MSVASRLPTVVIGAGVVGLACARALSKMGKEVIILDREDSFGTGTSSRNSEVIHAGIYYPPGSLKARACVRGKHLLYDYCAANGISHKRIGKVIVATSDDEVPALQKIRAQAEASGVRDLRVLTASDVNAYEPAVRAVAGLFSPSTGIIDSHALMLSLLGDAEDRDAVFAPNSRVVGGNVAPDGSITLQVTTGESGEPYALDAESVINAAGLNAVQVADSISAIWPTSAPAIPRAYFCKGTYFTLEHGKHPFKHLLYPVPNNAGLGVHVTLDLAGNVRFGPDTEWVDELDFTVSVQNAQRFDEAIRRYWPGLAESSLVPTYSGIRPKIVGPGMPAADFMILGPRDNGARLIHLLGIESPGLTASLAIAELVEKQLASI